MIVQQYSVIWHERKVTKWEKCTLFTMSITNNGGRMSGEEIHWTEVNPYLYDKLFFSRIHQRK